MKVTLLSAKKAVANVVHIITVLLHEIAAMMVQ